MVKNTLGFLRDNYQKRLVEVKIRFPTTEEQILKAFQDVVEREVAGSFCLATFSHISSMPAVIFPVKQLTLYLHSKGIPVLIDGAHVTGQIPLDISSLDPDFYLGNLHKWLYSPKTSAFLYVKKQLQPLVFPSFISVYFEPDFQKEFSWQGTQDFRCCLFPARDKSFT